MGLKDLILANLSIRPAIGKYLWNPENRRHKLPLRRLKGRTSDEMAGSPRKRQHRRSPQPVPWGLVFAIRFPRINWRGYVCQSKIRRVSGLNVTLNEIAFGFSRRGLETIMGLVLIAESANRHPFP
ncbi:MAG: hypothetical protein AAGD47_16710, partial [Pseudomonadota bacterium]